MTDIRRFFFSAVWVIAALLSARTAWGNVIVRISLSCSDDAPAPCKIEQPYLALVPPDSIPRRPAAEAIGASNTAELSVPAGAYVLVAFARGFNLTFQPENVFGPDAQDVKVVLRPTVVISGSVTDEAGRPLPNAVIARPGLDAPAGMGEFSPMGMSVLRSIYSTRTDEAGKWSLESPTRTKAPLLVSADGFAAAWIAPEKPTTANTVMPPLALKKAGSLKLTLDAIDAGAVVFLRPKERPPVPLDWLDRTWAKAATARVLEWSFLPAGQYDVYTGNPNPLNFQLPARVATVDVPVEGAEAKISLPPPSRERESFIKLLLPLATDLSSLKAYAESAGSAPAEVAAAAEEAMAGRVIYLDTSVAASRVYLVTTRELLLPREGQSMGRALSSVQRLPRATVTYRLVAPAGAKLPGFVRSASSDCTGDEPRAISVAVSKSGQVEVPLAAPCHTMVTATGDFAPLASAFVLRPGETRSLGDLKLSRSASAEVHVRRKPSGAPATDVLVRARVPRGSAFVSLPAVATDANGVARLPSLPAGEPLLFEAYKEGSPLRGTANLTLEPGASAVIDPLEIPEPGSLSITGTLDEDFAKAFPTASLFAVHMTRQQTEENRPPDVRDVKLAANGETAHLTELNPGSWRTQFVVRLAEGGLHTIDVNPVTIAPGEHREEKRLVKPVVVDGIVLENKRGISALVEVRDGAPGPDSLTRPFQSKDDGTFRAILGHEGTYDVDVRRERPGLPAGIKIALGGKEFVGGRPLELVLPMNAVVVHALTNDTPVPNVRVLLKRRSYADDGSVSQMSVATITDERGLATFDEVLDGPWDAEAARDAESPVAQTRFVVDPSLGGVTEVTLQLEETARLEGHIYAGSGIPATGAVDCLYVSPDRVVHSARAAISPDGSYSVKFSKPAPEDLTCGVSTMDGAILPFRAKPGSHYNLFLPPETGALTIKDFGKLVVADRFWLVQDDQLFDLTWAARTMGSRWAPLSLPHVPVGHWRIVRSASPDLLPLLQARQGIAIVPDVLVNPSTPVAANILSPQTP
jgi:hypothetical protein